MRGIPLYFLLSFALIAQIDNGAYSLSGVVTNSQNSEPVKNAAVFLWKFADLPPANGVNKLGSASQSTPKFTLTGTSGEFQFYGLEAGQYTVSAAKPGFGPDLVLAEHGLKVIQLESSLTDLRIAIAPLGVIHGKVTDQDGEPVRGVNITLLQVAIADGEKITSPVRTVSSDDRGMYRFWNLPTGKYYVRAAGRGSGTARYFGEAVPNLSFWDSFRPVYYGGARETSSAMPLVIERGTVVTADFNLTMEPAFKIRGTLANIASKESASFELLVGDEVQSNRAMQNDNGRFEVEDVTPGTYRLRVTQGQKMRGETLVAVKGGDVSGVIVGLAPAAVVPLMVRFLGERPDTKNFIAGRFISGTASSTFCNVSLHELGGKRTYRPDTSALGETSIANVLPGDYTVRMHCSGGYPISARWADTDLLANPHISVSGGVAPAPIEIDLKPGGGRVRVGFALDSAPSKVTVVLAPAALNSTGPVVGYLNSAGSGKLAFTATDLTPGEYKVYAFTKEDVEFRNPDFLRSLSGGAAVHVEEGSEAQVTVRSLVE